MRSSAGKVMSALAITSALSFWIALVSTAFADSGGSDESVSLRSTDRHAARLCWASLAPCPWAIVLSSGSEYSVDSRAPFRSSSQTCSDASCRISDVSYRARIAARERPRAQLRSRSRSRVTVPFNAISRDEWFRVRPSMTVLAYVLHRICKSNWNWCRARAAFCIRKCSH